MMRWMPKKPLVGVHAKTRMGNGLTFAPLVSTRLPHLILEVSYEKSRDIGCRKGLCLRQWRLLYDSSHRGKGSICGEREQDYGTPEDSFGLIGQLWTVYMGTLFTAKDVAMMLALLKVARIHNGDKMDSFIDLAGYAACAGEIVGKEAP